MSTRSRIIVNLAKRNETKFKFNPALVGKPTEGDFETPEVEIPLDAEYLEIYHHWDGYVDGVGATLVNEFNTYEKAFNLLLAGDESSILGESISPYYSWRGEKTEAWNSVKPCVINKPETYEEYTYLFTNGKWFFKYYNDDEWQSVEEWLAEDSD